MTTPSSSAVPAASPTAVHSPPFEDAAVATAASAGRPAVPAVPPAVPVAEGAGRGSLLSGGTSVPTGRTTGAALKPQSSSEAASR